jgi:hypothetical protein
MHAPAKSPSARYQLGSLLLLGALWGAVAVLSRQQTESAIAWTRTLFGVALGLTYVCGSGLAIALAADRRRMAWRVLAGTVSVLGCLLVLELAALLKLVHWPIVIGGLLGEDSRYRWAFEHDPELAFRRQPGARWVEPARGDLEERWGLPTERRELLSFTYDSAGHRNPTDLARADVVLIGDSYVEGCYVSDDQTAARRLEARLGRPVANLGVAGYGTLQELRVLRRETERLAPKVVVWFFFEGNDLYDDQAFENALGAAPAGQPDERVLVHAGAGWSERSFTRYAHGRLRRAAHALLPNRAPHWGTLAVGGAAAGEQVLFARYAAVPWSDYEAQRWEKSRAALAEGVAHCRERGVHVLLVFVPIKFRVMQPFVAFPEGSPCSAWRVWPIAASFGELCASLDVPHLDLTSHAQTAVRQGNMPYAAADTHWTPAGHALVAGLVSEEIERRSWLLGEQAR